MFIDSLHFSLFPLSPLYLSIYVSISYTGLRKGKDIDFIEQFNEKLLVKQKEENLRIVDVKTGWEMDVSQSKFMTPSAFIFLYENQLFLTFAGRKVSVWNFRGMLFLNRIQCQYQFQVQ